MNHSYSVPTTQPLMADINRQLHQLQLVSHQPVPTRKRDDARTRILKIALKEFATKGFHGVSTTEIAKASAVTQPLIHYHFKTKEALWKATVQQAFGWLQEDLVPLANDQSLDQKERLVSFVKTLVHFAAKHPEVGQFLLREGMEQDSSRLTWMTDTLLKPAFQLLESYYQVGVAEGALTSLPFAHLSSGLIAMSTHFFAVAPLMQQMFSINAQDHAEVMRLTDLVVQFVEKVVIKSA